MLNIDPSWHNSAVRNSAWGLTHKAHEFTCWTCDIKQSCQYRFDLYNLDGDCIMDHNKEILCLTSLKNS